MLHHRRRHQGEQRFGGGPSPRLIGFGRIHNHHRRRPRIESEMKPAAAAGGAGREESSRNAGGAGGTPGRENVPHPPPPQGPPHPHGGRLVSLFIPPRIREQFHRGGTSTPSSSTAEGRDARMTPNKVGGQFLFAVRKRGPPGAGGREGRNEGRPPPRIRRPFAEWDVLGRREEKATAAAAAPTAPVPIPATVGDRPRRQGLVRSVSFDSSVMYCERGRSQFTAAKVDPGSDNEKHPLVRFKSPSFASADDWDGRYGSGSNDEEASDSLDVLAFDARVRFNLGEINISNGHPQKAWDNFSRSLSARKRLRGPDHDDSVAEAHEKLGDVALIMSRYSKLHEHYDAALDIVRRSAARDDDKMDAADDAYYRILLKKADAYVATRDTSDAFVCFSEALAGVKGSGGKGSREVIDITIKLGYLAVDLGEYETALEVFREAVTDKNAPAGFDLSSIYYVMGLISERMGRYDEAIETMKEALAMKKAASSILNPDVCAVLKHMGFIEFNRQSYDDAIKYYTEALSIMNKMPLDFDEALEMYKNLVLIHRRRHNLEKALQCYMDLLDITRLDMGENCQQVARLWHKVGNLYMELDQYANALKAFKREGKIRVEVGSERMHIVKLLLKIAIINRKRGANSKARMYYEEAVVQATSPTQSVGDDSHTSVLSVTGRTDLADKLAQCVDVIQNQDLLGFILAPHYFADAINDMGNLYLLEWLYEEAICCYKTSIRIKLSEAIYDEEEILRVMYNLSVALFKNGFYDEAMETVINMLHGQERILDSDSIEIASTLNQMGNIHLFKRNCLGALSSYKRSLRLKRDKLGLDDVAMLGTMCNQGLTMSHMGSFDKALNILESVLHIQMGTLSENNVRMASTLVLIGSVNIMKGDYQQALKEFESALIMRESVLGKEDPLVGRTLSDISGLYLANKDYIRAKRRCEEALCIFKQAELPPCHPYMKGVKAHILQLDKALERIQNARLVERQRKRTSILSLWPATVH